MRTAHKLGLIGTLYAAEGLPFGFFTQALPVLLRQSGMSLTDIGLSSLLALPWALKFLWAPIVDRNYSARFGRRRSWIIPVQLATAALLVAAATLSPQSGMHYLFLVAALCNLLAATLDIATDGLAVSLLDARERGLGNGIQVAGYRLGMVVSGGLLLIVFEQLGWATSFLIMAGCVLALTIPVLLFDESRHMTGERTPAWSWDFVREPGVVAWLGVIFLYKLGDAIGAGMVKPFLVDGGMTLSQIGWLIGTVGFVAGMLGALLGGALVSAFGSYRGMIAFGLVQAMGIAGYGFVAANPGAPGLLYGIVAFENLAGGMATAAIFTMMMDACRPGSEGTDYTVQACVFVIAAGTATLLSGPIAQTLGYAAYFSVSAVTAGLAIVPIAIAARRGGFRALELNRRRA